MASNAGTYTMREIPPNTLTVTVKLSRVFRFRLWLGIQLIKAAGVMLNSEIVMEDGDE